MKINEAIEKCFEYEIYQAMKIRGMSPPSMLEAAALQCFLHKQEEDVENTIRAGLIFLNATGLMPK